MRSLTSGTWLAAGLAMAALPVWAQGIHQAAEEANVKRLERMLRQNPRLAKVRDKDGLTPLHSLAGCQTTGDRALPVDKVVQCARLLVMAGADVNARSQRGETPLHRAAQRENAVVVSLLLQGGADPRAQTEYGYTPLHSAASRGGLDVIRLLLAKKVDINARTKGGDTPLFHIGGPDAVKLLVQKGAKVNAQNDFKNTPLHEVWREDVAAALIGAKADVNARNIRGETPLHRVMWARKPELVNLLIKSGADVNLKDCDNKTPLDAALQRYNQKPDKNMSESYQRERLAKYEQIIELLKNAGAKLGKDIATPPPPRPTSMPAVRVPPRDPEAPGPQGGEEEPGGTPGGGPTSF